MNEVGAAPYRLPSGCPRFDHHVRYVDDNTDRYQDYDALRLTAPAVGELPPH